MKMPQQKIITLDQAAEIAEKARQSGKRIGFTNGVFDCLHYGHAHSLVGARKYCDKLFVGMNSDASVKRLKGDSRPLQDEKTRGIVLASLYYVDYVVVFDYDTAMQLVERIRPDVIAKEGYQLKNWPEGQRVASYGGKTVTLPRVGGYSTSSIFEKLASQKSN